MSNQYCAICQSKQSNINVRRVPKNAEKRKLWIESTGVSLNEKSTICDKHFDENDFYFATNESKRRRLRQDAIPQKQPKISFTEHKPPAPNSNQRDFSSQTETEVIQSGMALEYLRLQFKMREMQQEISRLTEQSNKMANLNESIHKIFTETQIRKLSNGAAQVHWKQSDIMDALCLHAAAGNKAYRHLYEKGFPLPSISTFTRFHDTVEIKTGPLEFVIELMKRNVHLTEEDKVCVLLFDEMKVETDDSFRHVQVAMVRGLTRTWKRPVYFDYDCPMTVPTLFELIRKLYDAGYPVVAIVSDMGNGNHKLWTALGISIEKTWFAHPVDANLKIFAFADVPHLLTLLRKNFLSSGLHIGYSRITPDTINQIISYTSSYPQTVAWQVTEEHLNLNAATKQKVKLATQLFSIITANAIKEYHSLGFLVDNACETSGFFQLTSDWNDVFNAKYDANLTAHRKVLMDMSKVMDGPLLPNAEKISPFQKGIIVSNTSLDLLYNYLSDKCEIRLHTSKLTLDVLHEFFDAMRAKLGKAPSSEQFEIRLRKYLVENKLSIN